MSEQISAMNLLDEQSRQVDEAELYEVRSQEIPVRFQAGEIESLKSVETIGRAIRVIQDGRIGFSTTTDLTDRTTIVQSALASVQYGDPVGFGFVAQEPPTSVKCFDPKVEGVGERELIAMGKEAIEMLRAYHPDLQIDADINKKIEQVRLLNTNGLTLEERRTVLSFILEVTQTREDDVYYMYKADASRRWDDVDGSALARAIIERLRWSERIVDVETRPMPVVFASSGTLAVLLPLLVGLNGRQVYMGASPLGDKLGQQVFDHRLSIADNGRMDFAPRSTSFDDEGIPTAETKLVDCGEVRQFMYDLKTAAQAGTQSTGNGFKTSGVFNLGFQYRPDVAVTNWFITPGDQSMEQILRELDEALLVEDVMGLGLGNYMAGEFSNTVAVGFLVRKGEIVGRIKDTMVAGNAYDLLKDGLIALSDQPERVYGFLNTPAIAIGGVNVVSKQ